jgi:hypothetical protein
MQDKHNSCIEPHVVTSACCNPLLFSFPAMRLWKNITYLLFMDRDSSVVIPTRFGLDGPMIESRWGRNFPHPSRPALGPTQSPVQWYRTFSRGKAAGAWR